MAFSNEFNYEIDVDNAEGNLRKYVFTFDSKESYSPNPEVLNVVKFIEDISLNLDDSSLSSLIFSPTDDFTIRYDLNNLNYYPNARDMLQKIV